MCFITASRDAALPPSTLLSVSIFCPGLVRLPPDWISLFRKRENGSLTHTRSAVWERPSQPPHRLNAQLFCSISGCTVALRGDGWIQLWLEWRHLAAEGLLISHECFSPGCGCKVMQVKLSKYRSVQFKGGAFSLENLWSGCLKGTGLLLRSSAHIKILPVTHSN